MSTLTTFRALLAIDQRTVGRDSLLRWMVVLPIALALLVRLAIPALTGTLEARFAFDLAPYYPLIIGALGLMVPQFVGLVLGFLLLDQRDDGTLDALRVTPVSSNALIAYRFFVPVLLSTAVTLVVFAIAGTLPIAPVAVLVVSIAAAPFAPLYGLIIACVARNKIQGFAVAKGAGILTVAPILAWFVDEPLQFAFGVVPTWWPVKAYWELQVGEPRGYLIAVLGMAWMTVLIRWLLRRFQTSATAR